MRILYIFMCVCISTINLGICANCAGHCVAGSLAVSVPMIMCIFRCYLLFIVNSLVFLSGPLLPSAAWLAVSSEFSSESGSATCSRTSLGLSPPAQDLEGSMQLGQ